MTQQEILEDIVPELTRRIVEVAHPLQVILFGSAARGQMGPESDLDVLVIVPDGIGRRVTCEAIYLALYGLGISKDILVVTKSDLEEQGANPSLVYGRALSEGRVLFRAQASRCSTP
jgi:predicted nucleotidyltransferase